MQKAEQAKGGRYKLKTRQ